MDECAEHFFVGFVVDVDLVEYEYGWYVVGFCIGKESVDEGGCGDGVADCDDEHAEVEVGSKDMALLGEVDGLAHDVVPAVVNG